MKNISIQVRNRRQWVEYPITIITPSRNLNTPDVGRSIFLSLKCYLNFFS